MRLGQAWGIRLTLADFLTRNFRVRQSTTTQHRKIDVRTELSVADGDCARG